jgi:hypothetical protein
MKKKSAIIGAIVITLLFILLMGTVGVSAFTNTNSVAISNMPASASISSGNTLSAQTNLSTGTNTRNRDRESNEFGEFRGNP